MMKGFGFMMWSKSKRFLPKVLSNSTKLINLPAPGSRGEILSGV